MSSAVCCTKCGALTPDQCTCVAFYRAGELAKLHAENERLRQQLEVKEAELVEARRCYSITGLQEFMKKHHPEWEVVESDESAALRASVEKLEAALREVIEYTCPSIGNDPVIAFDIANRALAEQEGK